MVPREGDAPGPGEASDEDLIQALAAGREENLAILYRRHASRVFQIALRSLGRACAEEVVQDVFLSVWQHARSFDPALGRFRPWMLQIAHRRVLNELRRRSRRPQPDAGAELLSAVEDPGQEPSEDAWNAFRRDAVRAAVDRLPPTQRQALGLAFFEELSHAQVASVLGLRLGTAKTRVRAGLHGLRELLTPLLASIAILLAGSAAWLEVRHLQAVALLARDERALALATSSDVHPRRLAALPPLEPPTHATYRAREGTPLAILTVSDLPPAAAGHSYRAWVQSDGRWTSLGAVAPDASGRARLVVEGEVFAGPVEALEITLEAGPGAAEPRGAVVLRWVPE